MNAPRTNTTTGDPETYRALYTGGILCGEFFLVTLGFLLSVDCFVGAVGAGVFAVVTFTHGQNLSAIPRHAPIILEWKGGLRTCERSTVKFILYISRGQTL